MIKNQEQCKVVVREPLNGCIKIEMRINVLYIDRFEETVRTSLNRY